MRKIIVLFLAFLPTVLFANPFDVTAKMDSVGIYIGQQTGLHFSVEQQKEDVISFPQFSDTIVSGLEILSIDIDTVALANGKIAVTANYTVTAFDSALIYVPSYEFLAQDSSRAYSNPLSLKVVDVPVDTTQMNLCDIKDVVKPPFDWAFFMQMMLLSLFIIGCLVAIYFIVRKLARKPKAEEEEQVDLRPAHEIAFEALDNLKEQQLWQQQKIKEYYTELTDILRAYLSNRFAVDAKEMTTDQILESVQTVDSLRSDKELKKLLAQVLQLADLVKFAKWTPLNEEHTSAFDSTFAFVDKTKLVEQEQPNEPTEEAAPTEETPQEEEQPQEQDYSRFMPK